MSSGFPSVLSLGLALALAPAGADAGAGGGGRGGRAPEDRRRSADAPAAAAGLPAWLEPNRGQARPGVEAVGRSGRVVALLAGATVALRDGGGRDTIRVRLEGASARGRWEFSDPLPGTANCWTGRRPASTRIPRFAAAVLREAWPGIDASFRCEGAALAYGFRIDAGADAGVLGLAVEGAEGLSVDGDGSLVIRTARGAFLHSPPSAWQEADGGRRPVAARFVLGRPGSARIALGRRDPALPTVVDPRIDFCSYMGGSGEEAVDSFDLDASILGAGHLVAADPDGGLYLVGATASANFPVAGTFPSSVGADLDMYVSKIDAATHELLWTAILGSSGADYVKAVAIDDAGRALVAGESYGADFPITPGAFQPFLRGIGDAILFRIAADGESLDFSTYFGGGGGEMSSSVACAPDGGIVLAGNTGSNSALLNIPLASPVQAVNGGLQDAFVAKLSGDGGSLLWSTYWGGTSNEYAHDVAVDRAGDVFLAGGTRSTNFPKVGNTLQSSPAGGAEVFLSRFSGDGKSCTYSTFLGGSADDGAAAVALDGKGAVLLAGSTKSTGFPLVNPLRSALGGVLDAFVAKLVPSGSDYSIEWSTLLGAEAEDKALGVALLPDGRILVAGQTSSTGFPTTAGAVHTAPLGGRDGFLARYLPDGTAMDYATYLGGNGIETVRGLAVSFVNDVCVGGITESTNLPLADGVQTSKAGGADGWIEVVSWVPKAPGSLEATPVSSSRVDLFWIDRSPDETSFQVARRKVGGPLVILADVPPNSFTYTDANSIGSTDYEYRVRAVNGSGPSVWSAPAAATTPPGPPGAPLPPTSAVATASSPVQAGVEWVDRSDSEEFFQVNRRLGSGAYATISTPGPNSTSFTDGGLLPGRTYTYRIRAGNVGGLSLPSNEATVSMPSTLDFVPATGSVKDGAREGKDQLRISGTLALGASATQQGLDPATCRFELYLGGWEGVRILGIPAGDEGWRLRKGRWTWKSPAGSLTKAVVKLDPATGAFSASIARMTLPSPMANPAVLTFGVGDDGGTVTVPWTVKKPGIWKYP